MATRSTLPNVRSQGALRCARSDQPARPGHLDYRRGKQPIQVRLMLSLGIGLPRAGPVDFEAQGLSVSVSPLPSGDGRKTQVPSRHVTNLSSSSSPTTTLDHVDDHVRFVEIRRLLEALAILLTSSDRF